MDGPVPAKRLRVIVNPALDLAPELLRPFCSSAAARLAQIIPSRKQPRGRPPRRRARARVAPRPQQRRRGPLLQQPRGEAPRARLAPRLRARELPSSPRESSAGATNPLGPSPGLAVASAAPMAAISAVAASASGHAPTSATALASDSRAASSRARRDPARACADLRGGGARPVAAGGDRRLPLRRRRRRRRARSVASPGRRCGRGGLGGGAFDLAAAAVLDGGAVDVDAPADRC